MNCHYCTYPIDDDSPFVSLGPVVIPEMWSRADDWAVKVRDQKHAHLACAIANVNTIEAHPDKSGKWCSYYHQPTGKWCMAKPGHDGDHDLEEKKS